MKKLMITSVTVFCALAISFGGLAEANTIITCASGTTGGGFYLLGAGMATILQRNIPGVIANNQSTGGAPENVRLVGSGQATIGLAGGDHMYFGYRGEREFKKANPDIRLLIGTYVPSQHMVVKAKSDIRTIGDFKGKKISTTPGFNANDLTPAILKASGLNPEDVKIIPLSFSEAINSFIDGNSDAFFLASGAPHPLIKQSFSTHELRAIGLKNDILEKMLLDYPYWVKCEIPKDTYKGQTESLYSVTSPVAWIINAQVPEDLAYKILKAVVENNAEYEKLYRLGKAFNKENALEAKGIIPLHPGAEKYYKEIGILK